MRRFSPAVLIVLLVLLLPPAAMARAPRHGAPAAPVAAPHPAGALVAPSASARATCTISGTALSFDGTPMAGADVYSGYEQTPGSWFSTFGTHTKTDAAGQFSLANIPVTSAGTLDVYPPNSDDFFRRVALNFTDGATFVVRPGHLTFITDHAAPGTAWTSVNVETYGSGGVAATSLKSVSGEVPSVATSVDHAVAYWFVNEGKELTLPTPIGVTPGTLSPGTINISEAGSQFISLLSPAWESGAPGTAVTLEVENWLAPMTARFSFGSEDPSDAQGTYPWATPFTGNTSTQRTVMVTIPKQLKPGYGVRIHMTGTDASTSLLDLHERFQLCTLVSTKTSISRGASVRLSGIIPANGVAKKVIVYGRTTKATAQPSKWDAAKAGWKKLATISATKTGAFKSGLLRPTRTAWYVVRYPGDSQNFDAFTGVLKVAVH